MNDHPCEARLHCPFYRAVVTGQRQCPGVGHTISESKCIGIQLADPNVADEALCRDMTANAVLAEQNRRGNGPSTRRFGHRIKPRRLWG